MRQRKIHKSATTFGTLNFTSKLIPNYQVLFMARRCISTWFPMYFSTLLRPEYRSWTRCIPVDPETPTSRSQLYTLCNIPETTSTAPVQARMFTLSLIALHKYLWGLSRAARHPRTPRFSCLRLTNDTFPTTINPARVVLQRDVYNIFHGNTGKSFADRHGLHIKMCEIQSLGTYVFDERRNCLEPFAQ